MRYYLLTQPENEAHRRICLNRDISGVDLLLPSMLSTQTLYAKKKQKNIRHI